MLLLDVLIRYPTFTLLLVMGYLCLRFGHHTLQGRLGAATGFAIAALMLDTAPPPLQIPEPFSFIVKLILIPNLAVLWLFGLSLFKDNFRMGKLEWTVLALYSAMIAFFIYANYTGLEAETFPLNRAGSIISAIMISHLVWTAFSGRSNDLIEARRRGRLAFGLGLAAAALTSITAEVTYYHISPETVDFIRVLVTFPLVTWALIWLAELRVERMLFQPIAMRELADPQIDPRDRTTHDRLVELFETDKLFTEQGLTIRSLSDRMKVPEHQLRALINKGMGYRNFADFLNRHRVDYAKKVLSDPEQARLPVLTIAMDAGYNSLAPFNRAFKSLEGVTPTEFRKQALADQ